MGAMMMQAAKKVKETTGIVGLDVVPNAREVLISLYTRTLKEIQAVPQDEGYRKAVESFTRHRLQVCKDEEDWEAIEKRLGCGQVEELIEEAQDELKLIGKMIGTKLSSAYRSSIKLLCTERYSTILQTLLQTRSRRGEKPKKKKGREKRYKG
ncbi:hypothetical protein GW17_00036310 [Ensete ventricosum]|nr:hypothetical protein GW17_00036310 [Ensete ventricosum]